MPALDRQSRDARFPGCGPQKFGRNGRKVHKFLENTELLTFIRLFFSSRVALVAENLFLRKQLARISHQWGRRKVRV